MSTSPQSDTTALGVLSKTKDGRWSLKVRVGTRLQRCRGYWATEADAQAALDLFGAQVRMGLDAVAPKGEGARADNHAGSVGMLNGDPEKWSVRMRVNGKVVRCRGYWLTKEAAEQALSDWAVLQRNGYAPASLVGPLGVRGTVSVPSVEPTATALIGGPDKSRTLLKDVYRAFLDSHTEGGFADMSRDRHAFWGVLTGTSTARAGNTSARLVLGDIAVGDITWATIQQWANSLKEPDTSKAEDDPRRTLSPSTRAKWGRHLKQLLSWAVPEYISVSPWPQGKKVVQSKVVKKTIKKRFFMSPDEMWRIADAATNETERLLFLTMMWAGLRQGEARALSPSCLAGADTPELVIVHAVDSYKGAARLSTVKTDGSERRVAIPRTLMRMLLQHVQDNNIGPYEPLFPAVKGGRNGSKWMRHEWLNRRWNEAVKAAKVERAGKLPPNQRRAPKPHDARATAASMLQYAGVMPVECQQWLGHEDVTMTLTVYTQASTWASRHPLLLGLRRKGFSLAEAIDWLYLATYSWHVHALGEHEYDSAERFGPDRWKDDDDHWTEVAAEVTDIHRAWRNQPDEPRQSMIPVRVPAGPASPATALPYEPRRAVARHLSLVDGTTGVTEAGHPLTVPLFDDVAETWAEYDPDEDQPDD